MLKNIQGQNASYANPWSQMGTVDRVLAVAVLGYLLGGRGFAELHVPGTPVYLGEILLVLSSCIVFWDFIKRNSQITCRREIYIILILLTFISIFSSYKNTRHDFINVVRDSATIYYMFFLFTCSIRSSGFISLWVVYVLRKYGLIFAVTLCGESFFRETLKSLTAIPGNRYSLLESPSNVIPTYAVILVIISLLYASHAKEKIRHMLTIVIGLFVIGFTDNRGVTLGAILCIGTFFVIVPTREKLAKLLLVSALPLTIFGILFFIIVSPGSADIDSSQDLLNKFVYLLSADGGKYGGDTGHFRLEWWKDIWHINCENFDTLMFGMGFGAHLGDITGRFRDTLVRAAHNAWVNVFGWIGLCGLGLYLSIFAIILASLYKYIRKHTRQNITECGVLAVIMFSWTVHICVAATFDNTLSNPAICVPYFVLTGSVLAFCREADKSGHWLRSYRRA